MVITLIKHTTGSLYEIQADSQYLCVLEDIDIERLRLSEGLEIASEQLLNIAHNGAAKRAAMKLLTCRRYSGGGLLKKLLEKGHSEIAAQNAVEYCRENGYIDDADYARRYITDAVRLRREGGFRIIMALKEKGIDEDETEKILAGFAREIEENLKQLVAKGLSGDLNKLRRKLEYKGYEYGQIQRILKEFEI